MLKIGGLQGRRQRRPAAQHVAGIVPQNQVPAITGDPGQPGLRRRRGRQHQQAIAGVESPPPLARSSQMQINTQLMCQV